MSLSVVKQFSISAGLYRPARWLSRRIRPAQRHAYNASIHFLGQLIPPGALCFDVGANVGEKSEALLAAGARVIAFEPNPMVIPELRARCGHDDGWTLIAAAVGSRSAISTLHACRFSGQSSLMAGWEGDVIATYPVPVVTMDAAIRAFGAPFYCKIDVEGWELEVLKGLTQPIPLLSFEFHLDDMDIAKTVVCLERMAGLGPCQVNVTAAEEPRFHLPAWMPIERFLEWFPGDLDRTLPGNPYGDIFVKRYVPRP